MIQASSLSLPAPLSGCLVSQAEALDRWVVSGTTVASGFATSEPTNFYRDLWGHIQRRDVRDLELRQALFMAPHPLLLGNELAAKAQRALASSGAAAQDDPSFLGNLGRKVRRLAEKLDAVHDLVEHFEELEERDIRFVSAFMSSACNTIIPDKLVLTALAPKYAGRNRARAGIVRMHPVHFPDAPDALAYDENGRMDVDLAVFVMTPPNERGELSFSIANGADAELLELMLASEAGRVLLYINPRFPFTYGHPESPNTVPAERFADPAAQGRVLVVEDDADLPALPAGTFDHPSAAERTIADHVVNHMETHRELTHGRAIQVGIGTTGVLAVKNLAQSSWRGRSYTEMLEPYTLDLWKAGKIEGSHFILADGRREELDGKLVCTFSLGVQGSDFYRHLEGNRDIFFSAASRVVIPEGFYYGLGINNILGIDFLGKVNSTHRDRNPYSGIGGSSSILRGLGRGGVAYLCLKSTHRTPEGEERSSIFPFLPEGTAVSMIAPDLMGTREGARFFLVTEHGVAQINARNQHSFIRSLISVAHPDHREELEKQAFDEYRVRF